MKYLSYIIFFALLNVVPTCNCNKSNCDTTYRFEIPVSFTPTQDSIHIGDTITIKMSFSDRMEDLYSGNTYQLKDFPFNTDFGFVRIDTVPTFLGNRDFTNHLADGETIQVEKGVLHKFDLAGGEQGILIKYDYTNNNYDFEVNLIPTRKGLYSFGLTSRFLDEINYSIKPDCSKENFEIIYSTNNHQNDNLELFQLSPDPDARAFSIEGLNEGGARVFNIID